MKRILYHLACLVALTAGLTADGQFAQFPGTTTTAVLIEVFGMGTQSTNALWAYRRFVP